MAIPEHIHTNSIIKTEQEVFVYLGTHTHHMYIATVKEKETMNLKESKGVQGGFGEKKGKGKFCHYNLKKN